MSLESTVKGALDSLVGNRCYPDTTPDPPLTYPLIIYQQVGGDVAEFLEGTMADKDNARLQVVVWSKTRIEANSIARLARVAIVTGSMKGVTFGAPVWLYEDELKLYGSRTQYGVWYTP